MSRRLHLAWLQALTAFIADQRIFPVGSDEDESRRIRVHPGDTADACRRMVVRYADREYGTEAHWLVKAKTLALFAHRAPLLRDMVLPIAWVDANLSRCATFDPLTYDGLSQVLHFIDHDIFDDGWVSLYTGRDGDRRILGEVADDHFRGGTPPALPRALADRIDKPSAWFATAGRVGLTSDSITAALLADLTPEEIAAPTPDGLYAMWLARPYDDFCPQMSPTAGP